MMLTKQTLKDLIANGKTEQAIEQLQKLSPRLDKDLQEDILLQSAKFKAYLKEKRQGTSSSEELRVILSQINQALIAIIDELPGEKLPTAINRKNIFKWVGAIAAFIAFLAAVAEFSGYSLRDILDQSNKETATPLDTLAKQPIQIPTTIAEPPTQKESAPRQPTNTINNNGKIDMKTEGDQSPAVISNNVTIQYNNDLDNLLDTTKVKKDSLQQKNN